MPIEFLSGDIFTFPQVNAFAHGCNCVGAMDEGIAKEFKLRWPKMYQAYYELCQQDILILGDVFVWKEEEKTIFNLMSEWWPPAQLYAIEKSLHKMITLAKADKIHDIALPRIGTGIGRLDWADVKKLLIQIGNETEIKLWVSESRFP